MRYAIEILSANERSVVEQLVADLELEATIPKALRAEVAVESAGTTITTG